MLMWNNVNVLAIFFGLLTLLFGGILLINFLSGRQARQYGADYDRRQKEREAEERAAKLIAQKNHGKLVYEWLVEQFAGLEEHGLMMSMTENNGGKFGSYSIHIAKRASHAFGADPILQLSYNFLDRSIENQYSGHIHYGAIGSDIKILVIDHSPMWGLDRHVLRVVHEEFEPVHA